MSDNIEPGEVLLGEVTVQFILDEERTVVRIGMPDTEDLSLVEVLGALELAKDTALKHYSGELDDDGV